MEESSSISNTWWELPPLIEFLRNLRKNKTKLITSINISIILHSATIIEGLIIELLNDDLVFIGDSPTLIGRLENEFSGNFYYGSGSCHGRVCSFDQQRIIHEKSKIKRRRKNCVVHRGISGAVSGYRLVCGYSFQLLHN